MIAFRNLYPNLPGHLVEFKDGGLALRVEADPPQTDSMLILGTAIDGPVMEPVAVDATTAELLFGKAVKGNGVPNGSTLMPAFEQAWNAGCRDIRLMRISGDYATISLATDDIVTITQKLKSETIGIAEGNDVTTIQLTDTNVPMVPGETKVYVKGVQMLSGFSTNDDTAELTINANTVDAGANVAVTYKYYETATYTDEEATVVDNAGTLETEVLHEVREIVSAGFKKYTQEVVAIVDNAGTLEATVATNIDSIVNIENTTQVIASLAAASYSFTPGGTVITLTAQAADLDSLTITYLEEEAPLTIATAIDNFSDTTVVFEGVAPVTEGSVVIITYVGKTGDIITVNENGTGNDPFLTATSVKTINLAQYPVSGTMHLYANGSEILTSGAFTVVSDTGAHTKQILINKEFVSKGSIMEITYLYNEELTETPTIDIKSIYGGEVYNQAKVEVVDEKDSNNATIGKKVILTKPESKKAQIAEAALEYSSLDYPTFMLMAQAINADPNNNVFRASTKYNTVETSELQAKTSTFLNGGEDGINMTTDELFSALSGVRDSDGFLTSQGAYQLLEDYVVDWVVPVGVYADAALPGKYQSFAYELALFCAVLSYRNKATFGAINMKPVSDTKLADLQAQSRYLASFENLYFMRDRYGNILKDADGNNIDLGMFINVVAGPEIVVRGTSLGVYNADPAVTYVAYSTTLNPQSGATNKKISSILGIRYRYSNAQLDEILNRRLVILKQKTDGSVCVVDDITSAQRGSDYSRRTTGKVVRECTDQIREVCEPFIGEPNTIEQRNAMSGLIEKRLGQLRSAGVVQQYEFQVISSLQDQLLGQAKIELTLVPPQELRKITTVVSLKPAL